MCVQKDTAQTKVDALIAALRELTQKIDHMSRRLDTMIDSAGQPKT